MRWLCPLVVLSLLAPPAGLRAFQEQPPTIRTTASEVLLEVAVRDRHGRLVRNLKPSDITILEDGVPQKILSFRAVGEKEARQQKTGVEAARALQSRPARSLRGVNLVGIVFHNLDPVSRLRAAEAAREFIKAGIQPDTYVGIFLLDDRLKPIGPFTNDPNLLLRLLENPYGGQVMDFDRASIAALTANPNQVTTEVLVNMAGAASSASVNVRLTGGEVSKAAVVGADVATGAGANALRGDQVRERQDFHNIAGMREIDKILTLIQQFGALPGRKTVLLESTGLLTTGDPDTFDMVLDRANKAGITVYSLDVRDLGLNSELQAGNVAIAQVAATSRTQSAAPLSSQAGQAGAARTRSRQGDALEQGVRSSDAQAPLRALAEGTGGFLIANTTEFKRPFQRIAGEMETYYEVAYRPEQLKLDGRLRQIEVKLARPGLTADSRTGYFALPDSGRSTPLATHELIALSLLNRKSPPRAFEFRTSVFHFGATDSGASAALAFEVPGAGLTATPDIARQLEKVHFSIFSLVKDASGTVVDQYSLDAPFEVAEANLPAVRAGAATYTHPLNLPPGQYSLETAVLDHESGKASTGASTFQVPGPRQGLALSSLVLVQRAEEIGGGQKPGDPLVYQGKRLVPLLASRIGADARPYLYFVVYPDRSRTEAPAIAVEFLAGGKSLARQAAALPAPDAAGAIPMLVAASVRPGPCEVRITATQGNHSTMSQVFFVGSGGRP